MVLFHLVKVGDDVSQSIHLWIIFGGLKAVVFENKLGLELAVFVLLSEYRLFNLVQVRDNFSQSIHLWSSFGVLQTVVFENEVGLKLVVFDSIDQHARENFWQNNMIGSKFLAKGHKVCLLITILFKLFSGTVEFFVNCGCRSNI